MQKSKLDLTKLWIFHTYSGNHKYCANCQYFDRSQKHKYYWCGHPVVENINHEFIEKKSLPLCSNAACFYCPIKLACLTNTFKLFDKVLSICFLKEPDAEL